jgi:formamidopyrimidine-DNA glycosylase
MWKKVPGTEKHIRAVFNFTDGTSLIFSDPRKFGRIWLYPETEYKRVTGIHTLGVEPFSAEFKPEVLSNFFVQKRGILKNTLLRQDLIAGIGNIYADEICHRIGLHPSSRLEQFKAGDGRRLYDAVIHCLREGIAHNGASVSDFVGTRGTLGKHQHYLKVYGRKGDPCYGCGSIIQKTKVAGRGTFVCLKCQVLR